MRRLAAIEVEKAKSMLASVKKELSNSPISTLSALIGVVIAGLALYLAWLQFPGGNVVTKNVSNSDVVRNVVDINIKNTLIVIAFFVSLTVFSALLSRYLGWRHSFGATIFSIVLASTTNFLTMVVLYLSPPRSLDNELFVNANDLVLYGSLFFYLTFCGHAVLRDVFVTDKDNEDESSISDSNVESGFILALILIAIWCKCVFTGQELLSETFLPEIAHPTVEKIAENA